MLKQFIGNLLFRDFIFMAHFTLIFFCFEISFFFIIKRIKFKDKTPGWILLFPIYFITTGVLYVFKSVISLEDSVNSDTINLYNHFIYISVAIQGIVSIIVIKNLFYKSTLKKIIFYLIFIAYIMFLLISIINYYYNYIMNYIMIIFSIIGLSLLPFLILILFIRMMRTEFQQKKKLLILMLSGFITLIIGLFLNNQIIENGFKLNYDQNGFYIYKIFSMLIIILGAGIIMITVIIAPPIEDFDWFSDLIALFIIDNEKGTLLFKHLFIDEQEIILSEKEELTPSLKEVININKDNLFISGLVDINKILSSVSGNPDKKLEFIDQGSFKIYIANGEKVISLLFTKNNNNIFRWKINKINNSFEEFYKDLIDKWKEYPEKFKSFLSLMRTIFPDYAMIGNNEK
ncbi:MAG: hypothetical protein ACTSVI_00360 [Promethearchaeota archaeon]